MKKKIGSGLLRAINARYSVSSWLWVIVSTLLAAVILLRLIQGTEPAVHPFLEAMPFNGYAWSSALIATGFLKMYGMAFYRQGAVALGSLVAMALWTFGAITFISIGLSDTVILLISPILIYNAYLFLGTSLRDRRQS